HCSVDGVRSDSRITLGDFRVEAEWMSVLIGPCTFIETSRFDDKCISFPARHRDTEPAWAKQFQILTARQLASVHPKFPQRTSPLEQLKYASLREHKLDGFIFFPDESRKTRGIAGVYRVVRACGTSASGVLGIGISACLADVYRHALFHLFRARRREGRTGIFCGALTRWRAFPDS